MLEVLEALVLAVGMTWDQLLALTADKRVQRGGFDKRLFLVYVDDAEPARGSGPG